jgi:FKBP-type peptidyl-prolyl cis-trans isomerase FklB
MQKLLTALMIQFLAASVVLLGHAPAQDSSSTSAQSAKPAAQSSTSTSGQTAAKKPATTARTATPYTLKTQKDKASYALGMSIGSGLHRQEVPVDPSVVARGLRDAMAGGKTLLTEDEMRAALKKLQDDVHAAQEAKAHAAGDSNRKQGEAFLAANKSKEGVVALPDGLQYKILTAGNGPKPTASDTVTVNYRGTLINGTEFDSSYKRGQPASFPVGGVIKGWTEALQLMPVGSKWQLFIPPDLAYGERGMQPAIGPNSTLIFEVELLSIKDRIPDTNTEKK